jgi:hypothetical protein
MRLAVHDACRSGTMDDVSTPDRRDSATVLVGGVPVGSGHPIVVQSMTNTDTADADATALQVAALAHAGSELVRITVNNDAAAQAVPAIRSKLDGLGVDVPLIGDFHYNGHLLLTSYPQMAAALAKRSDELKITIDRAKTTGAGACMGCSETVCLFLNYLHLYQTDANKTLTTIYDVTQQQAVNTIFWQGTASVCATPTRNVTWGRIKTLYR